VITTTEHAMNIPDAAAGGNRNPSADPITQPRVDRGHGPPRPRGLVLRVPAPPASPTGRPGDLVLDHGRHKGDALRDCPHFYVSWIAREHHSDYWRAAARAWLEHGDGEEPDAGPEPDPTPAATALPAVVWRVEQALTREYADDGQALVVVARAVQVLKGECSAFTHKPWPPAETGGAG
jgi:hypothetical protein